MAVGSRSRKRASSLRWFKGVVQGKTRHNIFGGMYVTEQERDGQVEALVCGVVPDVKLPTGRNGAMPLFRHLLDVAADVVHMLVMSRATKALVLAMQYEGQAVVAVQHNGVNSPCYLSRLVPNSIATATLPLASGAWFYVGEFTEVNVDDLYASFFLTLDVCDASGVQIFVASEQSPNTVHLVNSDKTTTTGVLVCRLGSASIKTRSGMYSTSLSAHEVIPVVSHEGVMLRYQSAPKGMPAWLPPLIVEVDLFGMDLFSSCLLPDTQQCIDNIVSRMSHVTFGHYAMSCRDTHGTLVAYTDPPSLFTPLRTVLRSLAICDDVRTWITQLDSMPDTNPLVRAVATRRAVDVQKKVLLQHDLKERLESEVMCAREMDGIAYDILLLDDATLADVPSGWQPNTIVATEDSGFLNMIYIHQWRATLERFIELAREAAFPQTEALLTALTHFRTGILWSLQEEAGVACTHRQTSTGDHIFMFNPAPGCMVLKLEPTSQTEWHVTGSLQTQCAKQRDVVVALFVRYAVRLLADLIHITSGADATHVASTLFGMYVGSLQAVDLRHHYKQTQRTVRELRQAMPVASKKRKLDSVKKET